MFSLDELKSLAQMCLSPDAASRNLAFEIMKPYHPIFEYAQKRRRLENSVDVVGSKMVASGTFVDKENEQWTEMRPLWADNFFREFGTGGSGARYMFKMHPETLTADDYLFEDAEILSHCWTGTVYESKVFADRIAFRSRYGACYLANAEYDPGDADFTVDIRFFNILFPFLKARPLEAFDLQMIEAQKWRLMVGAPDLSWCIHANDGTERLWSYGANLAEACQHAYFHQWQNKGGGTAEVSLRDANTFQKLKTLYVKQ